MFEKSGAMNFHRFNRDWKNRLQSVYVFVNLTVFVVCIFAHFFSTVTRSVRYLPECTQMILEDVLIFAVYLNISNYKRCRYQLLEQLLEMTNAFSHANRKIIQKCENQAKLLLVHLVAVVFCAVFESVFETITPITAEDLKIRRNVYRTAHPERRHPFNMRIPFLDESKSWTYQWIYFVQCYLGLLIVIWVSSVISFIPLLAIHMRGQYEILAHYIEKIGREHRDPFGNRIMYVDIENNEYVTLPGNGKGRARMKPRGNLECEYQKRYLGQIINFHKRLVVYQDQVCCGS